MADIIDLSLLTDSRRYLSKMLEKRGLNYFLRTESGRPFQLEPARVELVVRTALRQRPQHVPAPHPRAVDHARKEVRRELIRHVVQSMLATGL